MRDAEQRLNFAAKQAPEEAKREEPERRGRPVTT